MPRGLIAALLLGAALVPAIPSAPALAQSSGTRPQAALGLDASARRELEARLTRTEAERDGLADRLGLSRRLMRAVAEEVGLANPRFTDTQFFTAVESMAERAQELQTDNSRLREEITRLSDPALRDPALALLAEAEAALEDGRLADAEGLFGQIGALRWSFSVESYRAWTQAIQAQASSAILQGSEDDFDRANDLGRQREALLFQMEDVYRLERFASKIQRMEDGLREGEFLGRQRGLLRAATIFRTEILASGSQPLSGEQLLPGQVVYLRSLTMLGQRNGAEDGIAWLDEGISYILQDLAQGDAERIASLPLPIKLAFIELTFDRLATMNIAELSGPEGRVLGEATVPTFNSLTPSNRIEKPDDIDREFLDVLTVSLLGMHKLLSREDFVDELRSTSGEYIAAEALRSVGTMSINISLLILSALTGENRTAPLIDPVQDPQLFATYSLIVAKVMSSSLVQASIATEGDGSTNSTARQLLTLSLRLSAGAEEIAAARGLRPLQAESRDVGARAMFGMARFAQGEERAVLLRSALTSFEAAQSLRTVEDAPLDWALTELSLADAETELATMEPATACERLRRAQDYYVQALELMHGRIISARFDALARRQTKIQDQFVAQCQTQAPPVDQ